MVRNLIHEWLRRVLLAGSVFSGGLVVGHVAMRTDVDAIADQAMVRATEASLPLYSVRLYATLEELAAVHDGISRIERRLVGVESAMEYVGIELGHLPRPGDRWCVIGP